MTWTMYCGEARAVLETLPAASVHCVVTSPPYWGLRDDGHADQIGLEQTPDAFVAALVAVFREARRVLRDDGTLWLNLGDSYANDTKWGGSSGGKHVSALHGNSGIGRGKRDTGLKAKDLVGIPWRVAFALQADGWYLRSDIIWAKPNPMPESVTDRPTKAHEYVFLLTKSPRYCYNQDAIREAYAPSTVKEFAQPYEADGRNDYDAAGVQNPSSVKARIVAKARSVRASVGLGALLRQRRDPGQPWKPSKTNYTQGSRGDYDQAKAIAGARRARTRTATGRKYATPTKPARPNVVPIAPRRKAK